jgi:RNA polymerase sigma-70 factor (ECF subfamily)
MAHEPSDTELMLQVKRGDRDAFRVLVERYQSIVVNTIYRAIGDHWEAEDLAQKVFVKIYQAAPRYKVKAKFTTWMFTIISNTIRNEYRRRSRHYHVDSLDEMTEPRDEEGRGPWSGAEDTSVVDPSEQAIHRELHAHVKMAIEKLPERQRMAVILSRYEGVSYEELSAILKISVPAVKGLLHRARLALKEELSKYL